VTLPWAFRPASGDLMVSCPTYAQSRIRKRKKGNEVFIRRSDRKSASNLTLVS